MKTIKEEALQAITSLPDDAPIDDIMYRLYIIDKVRKGQEALRDGEILTAHQLEKEIERW
jgi:hypothetical protein